MNLPLQKTGVRFVKRCFDMVGCSLALVVLSPLLLFISLLLACEGGGVFYCPLRVGQQGRLFCCLKFRSMTKDAEHVLKAYLNANPAAAAEWAQSHKLKNDPRVTKLGGYLRRSSLDELPQLFNVLIGHMSLVGPRPVTPEEMRRYGDAARFYKATKPGMTGLWQISGRSDVSYAERVRLDCTYVKNWSLWGDVVILCKTIPVLISRKGAY